MPTVDDFKKASAEEKERILKQLEETSNRQKSDANSLAEKLKRVNNPNKLDLKN